MAFCVVEVVALSSSAVDWISILVAAAGFAVAAGSLWFTSLRRPEVELVVIPKSPELEIANAGQDALTVDDEGNAVVLPQSVAAVPIYIVNLGASPTVVQEVQLRDFSATPDGAELWSGPQGRPRSNLDVPFVLAGKSATEGFFRFELECAADLLEDPLWKGSPDTGEFARRLHHLASVHFTLHWSYRSSGFPLFWRRYWPDDKLEVDIEMDKYKRGLIAQWSTNPATKRLAKIATDGRPRKRPSGGKTLGPHEARAMLYASFDETSDEPREHLGGQPALPDDGSTTDRGTDPGNHETAGSEGTPPGERDRSAKRPEG